LLKQRRKELERAKIKEWNVAASVSNPQKK
jgi:hypothetical protein